MRQTCDRGGGRAVHPGWAALRPLGPPARRAPAGMGSYRVEHRTEAGVAVLHEAALCFPGHHALAPYAAQLVLAGRAGGELVLVDPATDTIVAHRPVRPPGRAGAA
jgi:hypothetical protein